LQLIKDSKNKQTIKKKNLYVYNFTRFLKGKNETRYLHNIPSKEMDTNLANFILSVRKNDGQEYEPTTVPNIILSIDRQLKEMKYPVKIMQESGTKFFNMTRNALKAKQKSLIKKMGKGNKPNACSPNSDNDINILYEKHVLDSRTPQSLFLITGFVLGHATFPL
jgi:hypothetical protein